MKELAIVCHDAGGAEVLSSFVRRSKPDCLFVLEGPARAIFERKLGRVVLSGLDEAVERADSLLCGTSWQSALECDAITAFGSAGKRSVAFLDHWVNYSERFRHGGRESLPDEIWVGDADAEAIARATLPGTPIRLVKNPYFADIVDELAKRGPSIRSTSAISVLYVCEPVREHAFARFGDERAWGYTEEEALRYFLTHVDALNAAIDRIVIRPHPSEARGKYDWARAETELPIVTAGEGDLVGEVANSDVVVGCESMAMVVGLLAGRRVVSCIPPGGRACVLPQSEIQHLREMVAA